MTTNNTGVKSHSISPTLSTTVRVQVRFSEVDSLRIVWHGNYLKYMEDAGEAFGHTFGLEYMYMYNQGFLAPMYDIKMKYIGPATTDDTLLVTITYRPARGAKVIFDYEIRRESDNTLLFTAETTQLFTTHEGEFVLSCPDFLAEWKKKHNICL